MRKFTESFVLARVFSFSLPPALCDGSLGSLCAYNGTHSRALDLLNSGERAKRHEPWGDEEEGNRPEEVPGRPHAPVSFSSGVPRQPCMVCTARWTHSRRRSSLGQAGPCAWAGTRSCTQNESLPLSPQVGRPRPVQRDIDAAHYAPGARVAWSLFCDPSRPGVAQKLRPVCPSLHRTRCGWSSGTTPCTRTPPRSPRYPWTSACGWSRLCTPFGSSLRWRCAASLPAKAGWLRPGSRAAPSDSRSKRREHAYGPRAGALQGEVAEALKAHDETVSADPSLRRRFEPAMLQEARSSPSRAPAQSHALRSAL